MPPTVIVLGALILTNVASGQQILFAPLAGSGFLIYRDPLHRMNSLQVMVAAQMLGVADGVIAARIMGPGYAAAGAAMLLTIILLVLLRSVHPPALGTALAFGFSPGAADIVGNFVAAVVLLALLVLMQRLAVLTLRRVDLLDTPTAARRTGHRQRPGSRRAPRAWGAARRGAPLARVVRPGTAPRRRRGEGGALGPG